MHLANESSDFSNPLPLTDEAREEEFVALMTGNQTALLAYFRRSSPMIPIRCLLTLLPVIPWLAAASPVAIVNPSGETNSGVDRTAIPHAACPGWTGASGQTDLVTLRMPESIAQAAAGNPRRFYRVILKPRAP